MLNDEVRAFLSPGIRPMYVGGQWIHGDPGQTIDVVNPATEKVLTRVYCAGASLVNKAVSEANKAFEHNAPWRRMTPRERERILLTMADLIESSAETIAQLVTLENGKLFSQAFSSDAMGAAHTFRYFAGWATKLEGATLDSSINNKNAAGFAFTQREPVGVVAAIVPWNFPFSIAAWKVAPALAAGCTVILKPSEETPLSALVMAQLSKEAGLPDGVFNVLTGDGAHTGRMLTESKNIDKITFTGSTTTGKSIGQTAMTHMTGLSLELGGKSPAIVFADKAGERNTVKGVINGIFRNQGQVCVAGSRVYIEAKSYEKFVGDLKEEAEKMKLGNGFEKDIDLGPLVSATHLERVQGFIDRSISQGAKLVCGGKQMNRKGYFLPPTILETKDNHLEIVRQEVFGPVLVALPFHSLDEAIELANDNEMGLAATVWTSDIHNAFSLVKRLEAGVVFVNSPVRSDPNLPLGGFKESGLGSELGKSGVYAYTRIKSVNIAY